MKKNVIALIMTICVTSLIGCTNTVADSNELNNSTTQLESNTVDKTVGDGNVYDLLNKQIITSETSCLDTAISYSLNDISDHSTQVVRGTITDVSFISIQGEAWTKTDIQIDDVLNGNLCINDIVSIYTIGGYMPLTDHIAYYKDDFRFSNMSKESIENTFIYSVVEDEAVPRIGDSYVYFLTETLNNSPLPEGAYERVCGKESQFDILDNGSTLSRQLPALENESQDITQQISMDQLKNIVKDTQMKNINENSSTFLID